MGRAENGPDRTMLASLIPLLRAAAAAEIAKALGVPELAKPQNATGTVTTSVPAAGLPQAMGSDVALVPEVALTAKEAVLMGLAAPRATIADTTSLVTQGFPGLSGAQSEDGPAIDVNLHKQDARGSVGFGANVDGQRDATVPLSSSALRSAFQPAMDEAMAYGAFPFTIGGGGGAAAALVIFNAAMSPAWPPALRFDTDMDEARCIRIAGSQLAQMTTEEMDAFLAKLTAAFSFLLLVKKRLARSLREEKEEILGLFALFGVAMDMLVQGMQMACDLTAEQKEILERVAIETAGQPSGKGPGRHRLKL